MVKWRAPITLLVLLVILLGAAYYGWQTVVDPDSSAGTTPSTTPRRSTPTKPVCLEKRTYPRGWVVKATSFKVNVFNAGGISGQAADVLETLTNRGFQEGIADNPPPKVTATNVSILTSTPNSPMAALVKEQFNGKVRLVPGPNLALGVDIVIGASFAGFDTNAPTEFRVTKPTTVCTKFAS